MNDQYDNQNYSQNIKVCYKCGHQLLPDIKFCSNCGAKINQFYEPLQNDYQNKQSQKPKMHSVNKVALFLAVLCLISFFNAISSRTGLLTPIILVLISIIIIFLMPRKYKGNGEHGGLNFLSFLFPILGFIFYFVWHDNKPNKAKGILRNAVTSTIINIIILVIILLNTQR